MEQSLIFPVLLFILIVLYFNLIIGSSNCFSYESKFDSNKNLAFKSNFFQDFDTICVQKILLHIDFDVFSLYSFRSIDLITRFLNSHD